MEGTAVGVFGPIGDRVGGGDLSARRVARPLLWRDAAGDQTQALGGPLPEGRHRRYGLALAFAGVVALFSVLDGQRWAAAANAPGETTQRATGPIRPRRRTLGKRSDITSPQTTSSRSGAETGEPPRDGAGSKPPDPHRLTRTGTPSRRGSRFRAGEPTPQLQAPARRHHVPLRPRNRPQARSRPGLAPRKGPWIRA